MSSDWLIFVSYSISVCTDRRVSDLMMKALFDLRRNYGFKWQLSLKQINTGEFWLLKLFVFWLVGFIKTLLVNISVLTNFGVSKEVITNEKYFNKDNVGLKKHLEQVSSDCLKWIILESIVSFELRLNILVRCLKLVRRLTRDTSCQECPPSCRLQHHQTSQPSLKMSSLSVFQDSSSQPVSSFVDLPTI